MTNTDEDWLLNTDSYQWSLAQGLCTGCCNYLKTKGFGFDYSAVYDYGYYLQQNPDVAAAFGGDAAKTFMHFLKYGMSEGRVASPAFDPAYYRSAYPGLESAFGSDLPSYYRHFCSWGLSEGRRGSAEFDVLAYRSKNPGLQSAFGWSDLAAYLHHYVAYGRAEGRVAVGDHAVVGTSILDGTDWSAVYDYAYYCAAYPALAAVCTDRFGLVDPLAMLRHFLSWGMAEGRQGSSAFNVYNYKYRYAGLQSVFINDLKSYYLHYARYGRAEGRAVGGSDPRADLAAAVIDGTEVLDGTDYSAVYDYAAYCAAYPATEAWFAGDPVMLLQQFLACGMAEGRRGISADRFDVFAYRAQNPSLVGVFGWSDLKSYCLHYARYGRAEGRAATGSAEVPAGAFASYGGTDLSAVYSYAGYCAAYPALAAWFADAWGYADPTKMAAHFWSCGMPEGRTGSPSFVLACYKANYPGLVGVFGSDNRAYYLHYVNYGRAEGRVADRLLDASSSSSSAAATSAGAAVPAPAAPAASGESAPAAAAPEAVSTAVVGRLAASVDGSPAVEAASLEEAVAASGAEPGAVRRIEVLSGAVEAEDIAYVSRAMRRADGALKPAFSSLEAFSVASDAGLAGDWTDDAGVLHEDEAGVLSDGAFAGLPALREVSLPASAARMGRGAFAGCAALESIRIPAAEAPACEAGLIPYIELIYSSRSS